jgi:protein-L-isoaspartate(D-aspartate) O-methyltransferase
LRSQWIGGLNGLPPCAAGFAAIGGSTANQRRLARCLAIGYGSPPQGHHAPLPQQATLPDFAMIDPKQQRINMVESQVRPSDVTDRRIIRAMLEVPREAFVPSALRELAYMDGSVPVVDTGVRPVRCLLAPRAFAKLVQLAEIGPDAVVLDVGCATGYSAAVLARLAKSVVAVEVDAALAKRAREALQQLDVTNAIVLEGALPKGAPTHAPFDAILLEGAVANVPDELLTQLKDAGRLIAIVADGTLGRAKLWRRTGKLFDARPAFDAGAPTLPGFARQSEFVL